MVIGRAPRPRRRHDPRRRFRNRLLAGMIGVALLPLLAFALLAVVELDQVARSTAEATEAAILQHQQSQQETALTDRARLVDARMEAIDGQLTALGQVLSRALAKAAAAAPPPGLTAYRNVVYTGDERQAQTLVLPVAATGPDIGLAAASATVEGLAAGLRHSFPETTSVWIEDAKTGALRTFPGFSVPGAVLGGRFDLSHPALRDDLPVFASSASRIASTAPSDWVDPSSYPIGAGGPFWTDPYPLLVSGRSGVSAWLQVGAAGTMVGADVLMDQLVATALATVPANETLTGAYPMLVSGSGSVVYSAPAAAGDFAGLVVGSRLPLPRQPGFSSGLLRTESGGRPPDPPLTATLGRVAKDVFAEPVFSAHWLLVMPVPVSDLEPNLSSLTLGVDAGVHRLFPVMVLPVVVLILVLAFAATTLLSRRMELPVRELTDHAVLEERTRLAREIHDTLAQQLTGIVLELEAADTLIGRGSDRAQQSVETARELARAALQEARRSVWNLRPAPLSATGLAAAIGHEVEAWEERTGIPARFRARSVPRHPSLQPAAEVALLRIAQEALVNSARHGRAASLDVELRAVGTELVLSVRDDGVGFDPATRAPRDDCFGLEGMAERARNAGGTLTVSSSPGHGTTVTARLPLSEAGGVAATA